MVKIYKGASQFTAVIFSNPLITIVDLLPRQGDGEDCGNTPCDQLVVVYGNGTLALVISIYSHEPCTMGDISVDSDHRN